MDLIPVVAMMAGGVLIWAALKNKNPLDVVQRALQKQPVEQARPIDALAATPAGAATAGSATVQTPANGGGPV
jgi:hypothetical protein